MVKNLAKCHHMEKGNTLCCIWTLKGRIIGCVITSDAAVTTFVSVLFNDAVSS